jgi:hypothetical protein
MNKAKVSVDVRVDPSDKAVWQAEADAAGLTLSELVRSRMSGTRVVVQHPNALRELAAVEAEIAASATLDLRAEELQPLRGWLELADSDGVVDPELLDEWKAIAARSGMTFAELLEDVVVDANAALV